MDGAADHEVNTAEIPSNFQVPLGHFLSERNDDSASFLCYAIISHTAKS